MRGSRSFSAVPTPAMRAARADRADEAVDCAVEIVEDLGPGRLVVTAAVGDIVELIGPDRAIRFRLRHRFGEATRIADVVVGVGIGNGRDFDQFGPRQTQRVLLFLGLGVGDDDDGPVPERAGDHRDPDPGVARGALDDDAAGPERASRDGVADDSQRRAVLDRSARVHEFRLAPDRAPGRVGRRPQPDERRAADRANDIAMEFHRFLRNTTRR